MNKALDLCGKILTNISEIKAIQTCGRIEAWQREVQMNKMGIRTMPLMLLEPCEPFRYLSIDGRKRTPQQDFWISGGDLIDSQDLFNKDGFEVWLKLTDADVNREGEITFAAHVYTPSIHSLRRFVEDEQLKAILSPESFKAVEAYAEARAK